MKYLVSTLVFHCLFVFCSATNINAGPGPVGPSPDISSNYIQQYDLSGLSEEEQAWFVKFIEGTIYADGWLDIADYILRQLSKDERHLKQQQLDELGYKIGREWCKDNGLRKIDTAMLKKWGKLLKSTAQDEPHLLAAVIDHIDGEVASLVD